MKLNALIFAFFLLLTPNCVSAKDKKEKEKSELDKISEVNKLAKEKRTRKLTPLIDETEELKTRYNLLLQKNKNKTVELEIKLKNLMLENDLMKERFEKEISTLKHENSKLKLKNEKILEELKLANNKEYEKIALEKKRISLELDRLRLEREKISHKVNELKLKLDERARKEDWKNEANKEPDYLENPFQNGILTITDRRISLNGPIVRGMADFVTDRIQYFNNKSAELPIFIVIDASPGGSVMQGYRILKAMEASKAPVYVLVKSFAASMAAAIATLAPRSYAYPNAILLHHQMSSINWGNVTQLEEQLKIAKEWERRVADPVARKMGITLKEFKKKMYEHNSDGDWQEFADNAVKYKWVDYVVEGVRETGFLKNPDVFKKPAPKLNLLERIDKNGKPYVVLPRLEPFDFYFIYNPDHYYRMK